jgi:hypothetical protein
MYAQNARTETPPVATINDRLNKVAETLQYQCERISQVLSRVNGTPSDKTGYGPGEVAQIRPVQPLAQIVEQLEGASARIADLATGVERIA